MKYKQGFSILETIISLGIVLSTLSFSVICLSKVQNTKTNYKTHYNELVHVYDIIQIIKSDHFFYDNVGEYFNIDLMDIDDTTSTKKINIYFDKYNNQTDNSYYYEKILVTYRETKYAKYYYHYYVITKYLKNDQYTDSKEGSIIYVTVISKV